LQPYKGPGYARIPEAHKDPDGHYAGFAARMRVYVVNRSTWPIAADAALDELDAAIVQWLASDDLSRLAVAQPMYGTTLSHYALLWHLMGEDEMKTWHRNWR